MEGLFARRLGKFSASLIFYLVLLMTFSSISKKIGVCCLLKWTLNFSARYETVSVSGFWWPLQGGIFNPSLVKSKLYGGLPKPVLVRLSIKNVVIIIQLNIQDVSYYEKETYTFIHVSGHLIRCQITMHPLSKFLPFY